MGVHPKWNPSLKRGGGGEGQKKGGTKTQLARAEDDKEGEEIMDDKREKFIFPGTGSKEKRVPNSTRTEVNHMGGGW